MTLELDTQYERPDSKPAEAGKKNSAKLRSGATAREQRRVPTARSLWRM